MDVTIEQLRIFKAALIVMLDFDSLVGNNIVGFVNATKQLSGTDDDSNRNKPFYIEKNAGSVEVVNGAGVYTNIDVNSSTQYYENLLLEEQGTTYSEARRNRAKLNKLISSIDVTLPNASTVALATLKQSTIMQKIVSLMKKKFRVKLNKLITTAINNCQTDTVMGDNIAAHTGSLVDVDNLIEDAAAADDALIDEVVSRLASQKNADGEELDFVFPRFWIVSADKYASVVKLLKTKYAVNVNDRNLLDAMGGTDVVVIPSQKLTAKTMAVFTDERALAVEVEKMEPDFIVKEEGANNLKIYGTWIVGARFVSRLGFLYVKFA